jgi:hypothetical protein
MECCTHCVHLIGAKKRTGQLYKLEFSGDQREVGPHILLCWFFPRPGTLSRGPSFTPRLGPFFQFPTSEAKRRRGGARPCVNLNWLVITGPRQTPLHTLPGSTRTASNNEPARRPRTRAVARLDAVIARYRQVMTGTG